MAKVDTFNYGKYDVITYMPTGQSSGAEWVEWHKMLKKRFNKKDANRMWLKAWTSRAGTGASASTRDLRTYMEKQGVNMDRTTMEGLGESVVGIGDFIGSIFTTFKYVGIAFAVILLAGMGLMVWNLAKRPKQAIDTMKSVSSGAGSTAKKIASVHPASRGVKAAKALN